MTVDNETQLKYAFNKHAYYIIVRRDGHKYKSLQLYLTFHDKTRLCLQDAYGIMYEELATIHTILYRLCCRDIDHVVCSSKCLEALAFLHDNVGIDFFCTSLAVGRDG